MISIISVDEYKIRYIATKANVHELRCLSHNKLYYRQSSE